MATAKTQDFTTVMKDMMGAFPVDTKAMDEAFKTTATLNEKLSAAAPMPWSRARPSGRTRRPSPTRSAARPRRRSE